MSRRKRRRPAPAGTKDPQQLFDLAVTHYQNGDLDAAGAALAPVAKRLPDELDVLRLRSLIALQSDAPRDAVKILRHAVKLAPDDAGLRNNLGGALRQAGDLEAARRAYAESLRLRPGHPDTLYNLGTVLTDLEDWADAQEIYGQIIASGVADFDTHLNMSHVHLEQRDFSAAADQCRAALELDPNSAAAYDNLSRAEMSLGRFDAAEAAARRALAIDPEHAGATQSLCLIDFLLRRWSDAWKRHEVRWLTTRKLTRPRPFTQPRWEGQDLAGKTILVWGEQGVGDEILFTSMLPDLSDAGARVVCECDERLVPLYRRSFPDILSVPRQTPPVKEAMSADIDFQSPSGSLGRWLRPDAESFPRHSSFLTAEPELTHRFRQRYGAETTDVLVGFSWFSRGDDKSMSLGDGLPLFQVPGTRFIDLQYGDVSAEREAFKSEHGDLVHFDESFDPLQDLDSLAAQLSALDLVISISTTAVHMAGALGIPTWVLLSTTPLWRWGAEGNDAPWYESVRLYRQGVQGEWRELIDRTTADLAGFVKERQTA